MSTISLSSPSACCSSLLPLSPMPPSLTSPSKRLPEVRFGRDNQLIRSGLKVSLSCSQPFTSGRFKLCIRRRRLSSAVICAATMNARCAAEQTQTVARQSSTITIAPIQGFLIRG